MRTFHGLNLIQSVAQGLHRRSELRQNLECIADNSVIGCLEERRLGIGIDYDNHLRLVDTRKVLDGTADACCDVQVGANGDACLADVFVVRAPANVADRTAARCGRAQSSRQFFNDSPILWSFQAATGRNHEFRLGQRHHAVVTSGLVFDDGDPLGPHFSIEGFDSCCSARLMDAESVRGHGQHGNIRQHFNFSVRLSGEHVPLDSTAFWQPRHTTHESGSKADRHAWRNGLAQKVVRRNDAFRIGGGGGDEPRDLAFIGQSHRVVQHLCNAHSAQSTISLQVASYNRNSLCTNRFRPNGRKRSRLETRFIRLAVLRMNKCYN